MLHLNITLTKEVETEAHAIQLFEFIKSKLDAHPNVTITGYVSYSLDYTEPDYPPPPE